MSAVPEPTATLATALQHAERLLASEPRLAIEQAGEILKIVPGHPAAELIQASGALATGRPDTALDLLEPLCTRQPRWPAPLFALAQALAALGRGSEALAVLRRGLALDPAQPQAWRSLGDHFAAIGDTAAAEHAYLQQLRHAAQDGELLQAADALAANRLPEAEQRLRQRLRGAPTDVAAIRMLAELAARLGRNEDAEALLARCLELAPGFAAARQNYATVLHRANKPEQALAQLERLLAADPRNAACRNLKAVVLCRIGDYAPAIELYDGLLREYPGQARVWLSFGHALKTAGQRERAIEAYRRCLKLDPAFGEAWWSLANLKTFRFEAADEVQMQAQLERSDLDPEQRSQFEFALGKAREDAADYAPAFAHYKRGNAIRRAVLPYRQDETAARARRATRLFTPEFLGARQGWGHAAADPIFVVGMPRAGSTLVEQILSSHPLVEGTMELPEIISMTRELRQAAAGEGAGSYHEVLVGLDAAAIEAMGERYLARTRVQRKTDAPRFIDKMPNNFLHVGLIHLMLPNARIVDVRRHPLACCFSGFKQYFARGQNFSYGLEDIGSYYRNYVALMAHFDALMPGRIHRVVYEQLVDDTETEVRRLLDYCGLPFDPACLRFFENERPVRTASSEQVRQPIYREGKDHWRHFEPWLGPLKSALGDVLDCYPDVPPALSIT